VNRLAEVIEGTGFRIMQGYPLQAIPLPADSRKSLADVDPRVKHNHNFH
jgi:hypothetical protein